MKIQRIFVSTNQYLKKLNEFIKKIDTGEIVDVPNIDQIFNETDQMNKMNSNPILNLMKKNNNHCQFVRWHRWLGNFIIRPYE